MALDNQQNHRSSFARAFRSVYVIGPADGPYKIGIADDPIGRLAELQCGNPAELALHHHILCDRPARLVEQWAHRILVHCRVRGEWFACSLEQAIAAVERANREAVAILSNDTKHRAPPSPLTPGEKRRARAAMAEHAWIMGEFRGER